jgi:hypothetical protein
MAIAPRWCIHGLIAHFTREAPLADRQHAKISSSQVENISKKLDAIEAPGDSALSKQKAIAVLAPKLHAMRSKGYTWSAISAWLKENGLDVTSVALQGYLRRARVEAKKNRVAAAPPSTTAPTSASTPRNATAGPGSEKQPAERAAQPPRVRYGTFVPREDTKDI